MDKFLRCMEMGITLICCNTKMRLRQLSKISNKALIVQISRQIEVLKPNMPTCNPTHVNNSHSLQSLLNSSKKTPKVHQLASPSHSQLLNNAAISYANNWKKIGDPESQQKSLLSYTKTSRCQLKMKTKPSWVGRLRGRRELNPNLISSHDDFGCNLNFLGYINTLPNDI